MLVKAPAAMVLTNAPIAVAVTSTSMAQTDPALKEPPLIEKLEPPAVALNVPVQLPVMFNKLLFGAGAIIKPIGIVSINPTLVSAVASDAGLDITMRKRDTCPGTTESGLKLFVMLIPSTMLILPLAAVTVATLPADVVAVAPPITIVLV